MTGVVAEEADLVAWGEAIGTQLDPPAVLVLEGPIGAGKSTLARAIARGAGVEGPLPSPTYNLAFRYETTRGGSVVHVDLYRIRSPAEVLDLGWDELFDDRALVIVEWGQRAVDYLPEDHWCIHLLINTVDPTRRTVTIQPFGNPPDLPAIRTVLA